MLGWGTAEKDVGVGALRRRRGGEPQRSLNVVAAAAQPHDGDAHSFAFTSPIPTLLSSRPGLACLLAHTCGPGDYPPYPPCTSSKPCPLCLPPAPAVLCPVPQDPLACLPTDTWREARSTGPPAPARCSLRSNLWHGGGLGYMRNGLARRQHGGRLGCTRTGHGRHGGALIGAAVGPLVARAPEPGRCRGRCSCCCSCSST